jgi:hypothetical protein
MLQYGIRAIILRQILFLGWDDLFAHDCKVCVMHELIISFKL